MKSLMTAALILCVPVLSGSRGVDPDEPISIIGAEISAALFCLDCYSCANPLTGHSTETEDILNPFFGGGSHDDVCLSGDCLTVHGICGGDDPDFDLDAALSQAKDLQRALLEEDAIAIVALLHAEQSVVRWAESRGSVQIVNCSGEPVANFPVDRQLLLAAIGQ